MPVCELVQLVKTFVVVVVVVVAAVVALYLV